MLDTSNQTVYTMFSSSPPHTAKRTQLTNVTWSDHSDLKTLEKRARHEWFNQTSEEMQE